MFLDDELYEITKSNTPKSVEDFEAGSVLWILLI